MSLVVSLALVPVLIALNAFFVASEYAVVAVRPAQVEGLRARGWRRTAEAMSAMKGDPAGTLGAIQVCITMANLLLGWIGEPAMSGVLSWVMAPLVAAYPAVFTTVSFAMSFVIVTLLTVVLSELLPKALTLKHVETVAALTAVPTRGVARGIWPLAWVMTKLANAVTRPLGLGSVEEMEAGGVTREEILSMTVQAESQGTLSPQERSAVLGALALGRRRATEIMVHRMGVEFMDVRWTMERNREVAERHLHSRMPLCDGGMDRVVGIVHLEEFFAAYEGGGDSSVLRLIAREPVFVPETITMGRLLETFRDRATEIAVLVDEHGGVEGIVTLQDVVDELVGEIRER